MGNVFVVVVVVEMLLMVVVVCRYKGSSFR